jgi:hypothetical protein
MATGDRWFYAWLAQCCTPYAVLSKLTGIPVQRLMVIDQGDRFTRAELEALATAWEVDPETLLGTHPTPGIALIPDGDGGSK